MNDIPLWRELGLMPDRMKALEQRVTDLEKRLERVPGETCPKCGEHAMRISHPGRLVSGAGGGHERLDTWACQACDYAETRVVKF